MQTLYLVGLLLVGVIAANIVKQFMPRIPDAFIFIGMGLLLSFTPIFHNFELEPEFFMLVIIAPLMFVDGQRQSFEKIRQKFGVIFMLSVVLIVATVLIVGLLTNFVETNWTLPLAIALVAIVTPTDAVAVKSITGGTNGAMPSGVGDALELESLFNDATGLVMLDLALSVLEKGSFSLASGLQHFAFVAIGGVLIGIGLGLLIVSLRVWLNVHATNPETTIIPISLLTPFAVYLIAEFFGVSGILAVVASGIVHNWESVRLRLTSTQVQLTSTTIWNTITNILNSIVFMILGLSLPVVWSDFVDMGGIDSLQLIGLSVLIYAAMLAVRYVWALREDNPSVRSLLGSSEQVRHERYARIFAFGGIHGTMTLAMAFSLPRVISRHAFPHREELIIVATMVILISMVVSALVLPRLMPENTTGYTDDDLAHVRNKMVDYATLQVRPHIDDHDVREALTTQLQTQKGWVERPVIDNDFQQLLDGTKDYIRTYVHSDEVDANYGPMVVDIYDKILNNWNSQFKNKHTLKHEMHVLKKQYKHAKWHVKHGVVTPRQRERSREQFKASKTPEEWAQWKDTRTAVTNLNTEVMAHVDVFLDNTLRERLGEHQSQNSYIYAVRQAVNDYLTRVSHDYNRETIKVDSDLYIQAFQFEYNFVQQASSQLPHSMVSTLYSEINQAQTLQLQQLEQLEELNTENEKLALERG
ncbi:cation:proton antiporter [Lacticaseibacillus saniviri]|uniref:NhaP-type Na+ H+ and K+ H+ antiporter n=1 Tax=Lacticaseibacillus saniviri JCM 17471 = DSM 24301 TaxID=1293598 RepID=A0A0R2MUW2_9LACO|nr:sodium:proton antiporter [Lacticaseibacillus saniviri]KRO15597.1 NhaP-type Na+ H+ and K+ H+ antiporter [Lacticaseibacillus saniviri JCM 17471 = DSM 24301]MCG4282510.1 sodium:proton antiporter [Lacticaseibacillus saniviri]